MVPVHMKERERHDDWENMLEHRPVVWIEKTWASEILPRPHLVVW